MDAPVESLSFSEDLLTRIREITPEQYRFPRERPVEKGWVLLGTVAHPSTRQAFTLLVQLKEEAVAIDARRVALIEGATGAADDALAASIKTLERELRQKMREIKFVSSLYWGDVRAKYPDADALLVVGPDHKVYAVSEQQLESPPGMMMIIRVGPSEDGGCPGCGGDHEPHGRPN